MKSDSNVALNANFKTEQTITLNDSSNISEIFIIGENSGVNQIIEAGKGLKLGNENSTLKFSTSKTCSIKISWYSSNSSRGPIVKIDNTEILRAVRTAKTTFTLTKVKDTIYEDSITCTNIGENLFEISIPNAEAGEWTITSANSNYYISSVTISK